LNDTNTLVLLLVYVVFVGYVLTLLRTAARSLRHMAITMDELSIQHMKLTAAILRIEEKLGASGKKP